MGLIGTLFTAITGIPNASNRALLDTLCLAALADGERTQLEEGYALSIALELEGFRRIPQAQLEADLRDAHAVVRKEGDAAITMLRIASAIDSDDLREQAFALASVIIAVDLEVLPAEHQFITTFRSALGVAPERAKAIVGEISKELDGIRQGNAPRPG